MHRSWYTANSDQPMMSAIDDMRAKPGVILACV